jgi:hypothetical protein
MKRQNIVIGAFGATALGGVIAYLIWRRRPIAPVPAQARYVPGSPEQIALFEAAARLVKLPVEWARSTGLINILQKESGGWVGRPNFRYGDRAKDQNQWPAIWEELKRGIYTGVQVVNGVTHRSGATGLGQLQPDNVDKDYPSGRKGIGNALEEAAGMLRYIKRRYGTPEIAWAEYGTKFPGY